MSIIPLVVISSVLFVTMHQEISESTCNHLSNVSTIQKSRIQLLLDNNKERLNFIESRTQIRLFLYDYIGNQSTETQELICAYLDDTKLLITNFKTISVLVLNGTIIASTEKSIIGDNYLEENFFNRGKTENNYDTLYIDEEDNLCFHLCGPLSYNSTIIGVVLIDLYAIHLINLVTDYTGLRETGETLIAKRDESGDALFIAPIRTDSNAALIKTVSKDNIDAPIIQALLQNEILMIDAVDYRGEVVLASTKYISETGWGIVVKIDKAEAFASLRRMLIIDVIIFVSISTLILIFAFIFSKSMTDPIIELKNGAKKITEGDFSHNFDIKQKDEIGFLAESFNIMTNKLINMNITLEERVKERTTKLRNIQNQLIQQEKLAIVGQLAGGIAHDFNNILAAIVGSLEIAADKTEKEEVKHFLEIINRQSIRASTLIRQISDFSGKTITKPKHIEIKSFFEEISEIINVSINKNITVRYEIDDLELFIDKVQLQQLIINLFLNSRDALDNGGEITISAKKVDYTKVKDFEYDSIIKQDYIQMIIEDNGSGMDKETLKRAFEPFFTTKPVGEGTGLGLSQVYGIIRQHSGYITIESKVGKGTKAYVFLPMIIGKEYDEEDLFIPSIGKILLIEDNEDVRIVITRILEEIGYKVYAKTNGSDAIKIYDKSFDLIITDMIMPEMDGFELIKAVQERNPKAKIIAITGYYDLYMPEGIKTLYKPITKHSLVKQINEVVRQTN